MSPSALGVCPDRRGTVERGEGAGAGVGGRRVGQRGGAPVQREPGKSQRLKFVEIFETLGY